VKGFVDTCIFRHFFEGDPRATQFLGGLKNSEIMLSSIVLSELMMRVGEAPKVRREVLKFLEPYSALKPNKHDWERGLRFAKSLYETGKERPKWTDLMIVETARGLGCCVYTNDREDFPLTNYDSIVYPY
jgi:predicted nucleic acid-binding protein